MRGMRGQGALTALRRVDGETGTARAYLQGATEVTLAGVAVVVDCDGALYWPDEGVLAIADLHLEKGSSFAARGVPLPPYDTAATLARLVLRVGRCVPRTVIAQRQLSRPRWACPHGAAADRAALVALQRGRDWIWIAGNHDPDPAIGKVAVSPRCLPLVRLSFATSLAGAKARSPVTGTQLRPCVGAGAT